MNKTPTYHDLEQRIKALEASAIEAKRLQVALKASEEKYRALVENAADIIYRANASGVFTFFNPAGTKLTGYVDTDLMGKHYTDIIHADYRSEAERFYGRQFVKKIPVTYLELPLITANQKQVWVGQHVQLTIEDSQITGFQAIARDITERKQVEEALRESEEQFRTIVNNLQDVVFRADLNGNITFASPSAAYTLGCSSTEEIIGLRISSDFYFDPNEAQHHMEMLQRCGKITRQEITLKRRDNGQPVIVSANIQFFHDNAGNILGIEGVYSDITDRKRSEDALRERDDRLQTIFENAEEIIHVIAWDGTFLDISPSWERFTGFPVSETIGKSFVHYVHPEDAPACLEGVRNVRETGQPHKIMEFRVKHASGKWIWFMNSGVAVKDGLGNPLYFMGVAMDITERKQAEDALKKSEQHYRIVADNVRDVIWAFDINKGYTFVSPSVKLLRGYTPDEAVKQTPEQIFTPESFNKFNEVLDREFSSEMSGQKHGADWSYTTELEMVRKDGSTVWTEIVMNILYNEQGETTGLIGITRDITERKQAEEALRKSEKRLLGITTNMPGVVFQFYAKDNGEYGISYVSERLSDLFEVPSDTELEDLFPIFISHIKEEDLDRFTASVQNAVKAIAPWNFEGRYIKPSGKMFWFHAMTIPTRHEDCLVFDGILLDVTERRQAENALHESEELYTRLVDTIPDVVIRTDLNGHILFANDYAFQRGGYNREEMEGRNILEFVLSEEHGMVIQNIRFILEEGKQGPYEYHLIMKDGSLIPFEVTSGVLRSADGTPGGLVHVCRDITLRQQNEQEKNNLQERLSQAQKMESVGRLAGGVAHDFNNMLNVILGHAEMAMGETESDQPLYAHLLEIRKAAERSADLTRQLLAFARKQTVSPRVIDMSKTVEGMLKMLRRLIGEDIHLSWLPGVNSWPVKIDPSQVDQILANLCVNARDAITGVGKVTIELENIHIDEAFCTGYPYFISPGDYILLAVSDDGHGMDKKVQDRLFEPFFTTKDVGKGTGLGLATVYGIVKQNKGFINVYSEPGHGTTFRIYLPRHLGDAEHAKTEQPQESMIRGHETVLVVEDESAILNLCKIMLEQQGYEVLAAATPEEAIRMAGEHSGEPHLLITDMVMPGMNGRDLAKRFLSVYPAMKCLFMSGYTSNMIAHQGILDEGVYFIQKPFSRKDLMAKVREVLDQK